MKGTTVCCQLTMKRYSGLRWGTLLVVQSSLNLKLFEISMFMEMCFNTQTLCTDYMAHTS